ncbi:ArnT family glycosyltransferase [Prochlorococcus marinus]|uniref:ArnT family glycosyltransferase n=1 Tax=Prochlorococcus marinus TaxID=1219 RepID=UPI0022B46AFC|nr:glycosyltransferase family 39 protein [Prochlorococcus marinus]
MIFCWQLGSTGLVDETPPLFAASGRAMSITGDWLTPRVNGLTRFDKPPLVYWLMGFFYSLPGQSIWDPLGTWSARLPSALSTLMLMLILGDTVMRWPGVHIAAPRRAALVTSLAFALSPLVLIWSRIAVSDALLCSTLGISLLLSWRTYVRPIKKYWLWQWIFLGLAVLSKGPVAIVLALMTLFAFAFIQKDYINIIARLKPLKGLSVALLVSIPWYLLELLVEGKPFWDSFFGYHNFQRLTSVVNSHSQPWWFFIFIMLVASLPFTPFLLLGLFESISALIKSKNLDFIEPDKSILKFASCWLISVFLLFTFAATKLPSYWLPATPAAAILIGISSNMNINKSLRYKASLWALISLSFSLALVLWLSKTWIYSVYDPEIPNFSSEFISRNLPFKGSLLLGLTALSGLILVVKNNHRRFYLTQIPLILFQLFFMLPLWNISDSLRQLPLRQVSNLLVSSQKDNEAIAMVGINKPSIHFYTKQIIIFEANDAEGLVNLADRLNAEVRQGWAGKPIGSANSSQTVLVVIDNQTSGHPHWKAMQPIKLGKFGIYNVWRIDRVKLQDRANYLMNYRGESPDWRAPNPEKI